MEHRDEKRTYIHRMKKNMRKIGCN